jgi:hypothetical protein
VDSYYNLNGKSLNGFGDVDRPQTQTPALAFVLCTSWKEHSKLPVQHIQTLPVQNIQTLPVQHIQTLPVQHIQTLPVQNIQTLRVQNIQTLPVQQIQTLPIQHIQTLPVQNIQTLPVQYSGTSSRYNTFILMMCNSSLEFACL